MKIISKVWGWECELVSNELYSCKVMIIRGGYKCSVHYHKDKDETFCLLSGSVILDINAQNCVMEAFEPYRIHRGVKHSFSGYSPFSFVLEVATMDKAEDSYRETQSGRIEHETSD